MANFEGVMRTNYFHVKDAEAFVRFIDEVETDVGKLQLLKKGNVVGFGCYGEILGVKNPETDVADYDAFLSQLQTHVVEGECIILIQIGHEKLNYVVGHATIFGCSGKSEDGAEQPGIQYGIGLLNYAGSGKPLPVI